MSDLDDACGETGADKLSSCVEESLVEHASIQDLGRRDADGHCWVQGSTSNASNGEATHSHARADCQAKHLLRAILCLRRNSNAEHDEAQCKGEDDLSDDDLTPLVAWCRAERKGL